MKDKSRVECVCAPNLNCCAKCAVAKFGGILFDAEANSRVASALSPVPGKENGTIPRFARGYAKVNIPA